VLVAIQSIISEPTRALFSMNLLL